MRTTPFGVVLILFIRLAPFASVDECFYPRRNFILSVRRVMCPVPLEDRALDMRHGYQVATCAITQHSCVVIGAIRIMRIFLVSIFGHDVVLLFCMWQVEFTLTMGNPYTQGTACKCRQHDRAVLLHFYRHEIGFVFL